MVLFRLIISLSVSQENSLFMPETHINCRAMTKFKNNLHILELLVFISTLSNVRISVLLISKSIRMENIEVKEKC